MRRDAILLSAVLTCAFFFAGCGGNGAVSATNAPQTVQLNIVSISPASVAAGSGNFTLTITGTGLEMSTRVNFGSATLAPSSVAPANCGTTTCEALAVPVPGQDVATAGAVTVSAANASQVSNSVTFAIAPPSGSVSGPPNLIILAPMVERVGFPAPLFLTVGATNVAQDATVNFGSLVLTPNTRTTISHPGAPSLTTLQVQVPVSALASAAQVAVTITNPGASGGTSNAGTFFIVSKSAFPIEESVSSGSPPVVGDGPSTHSSMAMDGLLVAFDSTATNLIAGATSGLSQVYVRQNCFAVSPNCASPMTLVSVAPDGSPGAGGIKGSDKPAISLDGRFIAFESDDTNLVPGVTQAGEQIYLRDTCQSLMNTTVLPAANCTPKTILVSASPSGAPGNSASTNPVLGTFGLSIAFQSAATNLVSQSVPAGVQQIYLERGCSALLTQAARCPVDAVLLSMDASGNAGIKDSTNPAMDPDGLVVGFQSLADNIVPNMPGNGFEQIYLRSTCAGLVSAVPGALCKNTAQVASVDASGHLGTGDSVTPAVDSFGSVTVFATRAPNLLPANTSNQQIFATSTCFGAPAVPCVAAAGGVISVDQNGLPGQGDSSNPTLGGINRVAFTSQASLLSGVTGQQVYASNVCTFFGGLPCAPTTVLVSSDSGGKPVGGDHAAMEIMGEFATFSSAGLNATPGPMQTFLAAPFF
jgi:hypothetical protein